MGRDDAFDLSILDSGDPARAIVVARNHPDLAIEPLACARVKELIAFRETLAKAAAGDGQRPSEAQLAQFGRDLFELLVQGSVARIYQRLPPKSHIRLQIYSNRADLQALPWEFLVQPGTPPGPNSLRSVVRVVPTIGVESPAPKSLSGGLRMLFVYAEPGDQAGVSWADIRDTIQDEFEVRAPAAFTMDIVEGASPAALFNALQAEAYDVLHFAGHGQVSQGVGELLFVNRKTNKSVPLSASRLGTLLRDSELRLVVLSACSSSAGDFARDFAVVSKTLVESGMPAVVANQFPITNSIAATFAGAFYGELLRTGDVDRAATKGRVLLDLEPRLGGGAARFEWGIPTVYRHAGAARILEP